MMDIGKDLQDAYECGRQDALNELMKYTYAMLTAEKFGLQHKIKSMMADRKIENSSEKPNNCEKDCFLCKWLGDVDVCGRCRNRNLFAEADTEPTISKMEQVEDETRLTAKCLNCANGSSYKCSKCDGEMYYKYDKDEPQIFICPIQNNYEALIEDEPQTDCAWK